MAEPNAVGGPKRRSLLDGLILGLFGTPTDEMTPEQAAKTERAREADRDKAHAMAQSAWKNPGAEWMNGPQLGGGDLMQTIAKIMTLGG